MSLLSVIKVKLGQAADSAKNFLWDASAADGTLKLLRENGQQIMTVNALGEVDFPQMIRSLTGNGYLKLPSGLIIQWGKSSIAIGATSALVTFPTSFPTIVPSILLTKGSSDPAQGGLFSYSLETRNSFTLTMKSTDVGITYFHWMAIGY